MITEIPMPEKLKGQYQDFTKANNSKLLEVMGDYQWQTVEEYVKKNVNKFLIYEENSLD